jgi:hypothetical protein
MADSAAVFTGADSFPFRSDFVRPEVSGTKLVYSEVFEAAVARRKD